MAVRLHGREHSVQCDEDPENNEMQVCRFLVPSVTSWVFPLCTRSTTVMETKQVIRLKHPDGCDGDSCRNHPQPSSNGHNPCYFLGRDSQLVFRLVLKESEAGAEFLFNKWGEKDAKGKSSHKCTASHDASIFGSCCLSRCSRGAERYRQQLLTAINTRG